MSTSEPSAIKQPQEPLQSLPPTPESHPNPLEDGSISEAPSATSTNSRRKYQRGGRKKSCSARKPRKSRIGPIVSPEPSDNEDALFEAAERELVQDGPDEGIGEVDVEEHHDDPEEEYYEEEEDELPPPLTQRSKPAHREPKAPSSARNESYCPNCAAKPQSKPQRPQPTQKKQKPPSPFETGIKAFNLKRAESSGGRPIHVRAQPTTKSAKAKTKTTNKGKKSGKASVGSEEESEEEGSVDSFEEQKQKPMSIRLDLNLMVEIFLKAKIKGDVTITFLE